MRRASAAFAAAMLWGASSGAQVRVEYYRGYQALRGDPRVNENIFLGRDVNRALSVSSDGAAGTTPWEHIPAAMTTRSFTARFSGGMRPSSAGLHRYRLGCQGECVLVIDGTIVAETLGDGAAREVEGSAMLSASRHFVEVYFSTLIGASQLRVSQMAPGESAFVTMEPSMFTARDPVEGGAVLVNFDSLREDEEVTDQFRASTGLQFLASPVVGGLFTSRPRTVRSEITASRPFCVVNRSQGVEPGENSANIPLRFRFDGTMRRVGVREGSLYTGPLPPTGAALRLYDGRGRIVAADYADGVAPAVTFRLHAERGAGDIVSGSIDFLDSSIEERIDDLFFEPTGRVAMPEMVAPVVTITAPAEGADITSFGGLVALRVRVEDDSGVESPQVVARPEMGSRLTATLTLDPVSEADCVAPRCAYYRGSLNLPEGQAELVATTLDVFGNAGTSAPVRVRVRRQSAIVVRDEFGSVVQGATVLLDGRRLAGATDAQGRLLAPTVLVEGQTLEARRMVVETDALAPGHMGGGARNWSWRPYITSTAIADDGSAQRFEVSRPTEDQVLVLRRENTVVGLHLLASIEWDATATEIEGVRANIAEASQALYNASDGQFFIERAEIVDERARWEESDYQIEAGRERSQTLPWAGGFLYRGVVSTLGGQGHMYMRPNASGVVFAHEFGHYGFDLFDEYDYVVSNGHCTGQAYSGGSSAFSTGQPHASCLMAINEAKLCSGHPSNGHFAVTLQGPEPCFDHVVRQYAAPTTGLHSDAWRLRSTSLRTEIPGTLPPLPEGWATEFVVENRRSPAGPSCEPVVMATMDPTTMLPRGGVEVFVQRADGRVIRLGVSNNNPRFGPVGLVTLRGLHVGDALRFGNGVRRAVTALECVPVP